MNRVKNDILMHYGRSVDDGAPGLGSGRYPKGSGEDPNQHSINFAERVQELKKNGMDEKDIAKAVGCKSTTELRSLYKISINDKRSRLVDRAMALKADGKTRSEIARLMGVAPSTVDSYLKKLRLLLNTSKDKSMKREWLMSEKVQKYIWEFLNRNWGKPLNV